MLRWIWASIDRPVDRFEQGGAFWGRVTGTRLSARRGGGGEFATLLPPTGDPCLKLQRVRGPGGAHLDLEVDDVSVAVGRARDLGATVVTPHGDWAVLRSPGGQPFCLTPWEGHAFPPAAVTGPTGTTTLLDQVCIDVAAAAYESEVAFWTALTGWEFQAGALPEFDVVKPPAGTPVRILLQRLDSDRPTSAHLDLACSDVEAAGSWHEELGARVVGRWPLWTVMADPAGGTYCLTVRHPRTGRLPDWARSRV